MLKIEQTGEFKRDYKREKKGRHRATLEATFVEVLNVLANNQSLAEKHRDHALTGDWKDHRDCHIKHHLIPYFNPKSIESCVETDRYLEEQREKTLPVFKMLKGMVDHHVELKAKVAKYFSSDEGKKLFELSGFRQSPLVILLADISAQMARPDGWTLLTVAGELIRKHAPEERTCLKEKYGHKTLKELIVATELFEIFEEPTDKGGIRVLYRLKPDWELQKLEE